MSLVDGYGRVDEIDPFGGTCNGGVYPAVKFRTEIVGINASHVDVDMFPFTSLRFMTGYAICMFGLQRVVIGTVQGAGNFFRQNSFRVRRDAVVNLSISSRGILAPLVTRLRSISKAWIILPSVNWSSTLVKYRP